MLAFSFTCFLLLPHVIDYVCFGVDAAGKLSDDRYMIFFNQPHSPCNSIALSCGSLVISSEAFDPIVARLSPPRGVFYPNTLTG